jgi:hypothetical protein
MKFAEWSLDGYNAIERFANQEAEMHFNALKEHAQ